MNHLFYFYGCFYIGEILFHLLKRKKIDESDVMNFDRDNMEEAVEHAKKHVNPTGIVLSIIGFVWLVVGLFTPHTIIFASILVMNIVVPMYMVKKPVEELIKLNFVWSITQIALVVLILYLYFAPIIK